MIAVSPLTQRCIARVFSPEDAPLAIARLEEDCSNNIHWPNPSPLSLERPRLAVVKLSNGSLSALDDAIQLAKTDWRDLLVCAQFAESVEAHREWAQGL